MGKYKIIALVVSALLIFAGIGGYFLVKAQTSQKEAPKKEQTEEKQETIKELKAEDIGLTLTPRADKKAIIMTIMKLDNISSIEYEATYDAEVKDGGQILSVGRGVGPSTIEIKSTDKKLRREIELGSCSRNVCKYDQGVSEVEFSIKVNYKNGEVGSVEEKVSL